MPNDPSGLERAREVVARLRGENGCPWDRAQTHESLRRYLLEETYETLEALDGLATGDGPEKLKEELGDVLLQVLLHAEIAAESGAFDIDSLAHALADKLIRRHPHVFGSAEERLASPEAVVNAWEKNKAKEQSRDSALDGLPPAMPALQHSLKVIERVSKVGFQWPSLEGPLEKVREELQEFLAEVDQLPKPFGRDEGQGLSTEFRRRLEGEIGDLMFSIANIAHFLHVNPEDALRSMLKRFERRFRFVECRAKAAGKKLTEMSLAEMDVFWDEAKRAEKN